MSLGKEINIELIAHGGEAIQSLSISAHVKKYIERFQYSDKLPAANAAVAYFESNPLDSWENIQLVDKTYIFKRNSTSLMDEALSWKAVAANSFVSAFKEIAISDRVVVDEYGRKKPLFFKHKLPANTIEAYLEVVEDGNKLEVNSGLIVDLAEDKIWTNYENYFDLDSGSYRLYFVSSVSEDPEDPSKTISSKRLLNPVPAIDLATWRDLDSEGRIKSTCYSVEEVSGGWNYTVHSGYATSGPDGTLASRRCESKGKEASDFYYKPLSEGYMRCLLPAGRTPEDPWVIRITKGNFYQLANGELNKYWVPEYEYQPFSPHKPFIYSPYRKLVYLNNRHLAATRSFLAIDPSEARHLEIFAYDHDGVLVSVWTTDETKELKRHSDTDIFYKKNIISWDNRLGVFSLGTELDPAYDYYANFFYEAKDFEFGSITLNPLQYPKALAYTWVYYCVPNAHKNDRGIHVLGVDAHGQIAFCSQSLGRSYPNLQLKNTDGSFNPHTIIGLPYQSLTDSNNFQNKFCAPYINDNQYYVLAEVNVMDIGDEEESFVVDIREAGNTLKRDVGLGSEHSPFEEAIRSNPKILQSRLGFGKDGQSIPRNNIMVVNAPISLLNEYGGHLSKSVAETLLKKNLPASATAIIKWNYPEVAFSGWSDSEGKIKLTLPWEGLGLIYKLYRTENPSGEWSLIAELPALTQLVGDTEYVDENLASEKIYYYCVRVKKDDIEYPRGPIMSALAR